MFTTTTAPLAQRGPDGLAVIGSTRHQLMGIRYNNGENGAGGGNDDAAAQAAAAAGSKPPWGDDPSKFDPDKAWQLIQNVKGDLAAEKQKRDDAIAAAVADATDKATKGALAEFAKLLGGGEQQETDPAKLAEKVTDLSGKVEAANSELTKAQADIKSRDLQLAVAIAAPALGANTALLLKNEEFKNSITSVEPTDEAAITAAITKALQANAALKQPPARSGAGDHTGPTIQSLEAQLAAADEKRDFAETIRLKRAIAAAKASTQ